MTLPQAANPTTDGQQQQQQGSADSSTRRTVSSLPPEALALTDKLFNMAREGSTAALQQYVAAGIPANLTNHKGDTLLMLAAYHGHSETVAMLLEQGADANALNDRGQSPIAGAVFKGYDAVVEALVAKGADLQAGHPNAIDSARMFKREECLRMFGVENEQEAE